VHVQATQGVLVTGSPLEQPRPAVVIRTEVPQVLGRLRRSLADSGAATDRRRTRGQRPYLSLTALVTRSDRDGCRQPQRAAGDRGGAAPQVECVSVLLDPHSRRPVSVVSGGTAKPHPRVYRNCTSVLFEAGISCGNRNHVPKDVSRPGAPSRSATGLSSSPPRLTPSWPTWASRRSRSRRVAHGRTATPNVSY
jgi:hypothetical protein